MSLRASTRTPVGRRRDVARLEALYLLAETDQSTVAVPGMALEVSASGLRVHSPRGEVVGEWEWPEMGDIRILAGAGAQVASAADGHPDEATGDAWVGHDGLEVWAKGRRHVFLVPASETADFLTTFEALRPARRRHGRTGGGRRTRGPQSPAERVRSWRRSLHPRHAAPRRHRVEPLAAVAAFCLWTRSLRARHAAGHRWRVPVIGALGALLLLAGGIAGSTAGDADAPPNRANGSAGMAGMERTFGGHRAAHLSPATTKPEPAPPTVTDAPALRPHEIFGYAPYWTLPISSGFDVSDLTTLAYFSVDVNADGSISHSGAGWNGYQSQDLVNLVDRAHQAGDRVVLTATCFDQGALNTVTSDPSAPARLASSLIKLVAAKNLDGVNFDFEGEGSGDQIGLDHLVAYVSAALKAADPHWQVTMATYASSAGDPAGFYDIPGLAPSVDGFFVMAYDMNNFSEPSPTAALSGSGAFTDLDAVTQYTSVVPAAKVILGVPFYGYDWPTNGPAMGDPATGPSTPLSYAQIASSGHPTYWDAATDTAWTSYRVGGQWHQTWFDNPASMALKAELANQYHLAGLGIWALGMDGNDPAMMAALTGDASIIKDFEPNSGPIAASVSLSSPRSSVPGVAHASRPRYRYRGVWDGKWVTLLPADPALLPGHGAGVTAGSLGTFTTDNPAVSCLAREPSLSVTALRDISNVYLVEASRPWDCAGGAWVFESSPPTSHGGGGSTTTPTTSTTSTTTTSSSPTTTSTTTPSSTTTTSGTDATSSTTTSTTSSDEPSSSTLTTPPPGP